jgi:hypothetical protein
MGLKYSRLERLHLLAAKGILFAAFTDMIQVKKATLNSLPTPTGLPASAGCRTGFQSLPAGLLALGGHKRISFAAFQGMIQLNIDSSQVLICCNVL